MHCFGCSACSRPTSKQIDFNGFPAKFQALVPEFYLTFAHGIIPKSFLNPLKIFHRQMFKFQANLYAYLLWIEWSHNTQAHLMASHWWEPVHPWAVKSSVIWHESCVFGLWDYQNSCIVFEQTLWIKSKWHITFD